MYENYKLTFCYQIIHPYPNVKPNPNPISVNFNFNFAHPPSDYMVVIGLVVVGGVVGNSTSSAMAEIDDGPHGASTLS